MKIIYHHRTQAEDAQGVHIRELVKAFRDLGHKVDILSLVDKKSNTEKRKEKKVWRFLREMAPAWFYEIMSVAYNAYGFVYLRRMVKANCPDLIYERYSLNTFCGILVSKLCGVPLVLEVNAPLYQEMKKLQGLRFAAIARYLERWICSNSTMTIVVTKALKNILLEEGVPEERMVVMHNGIDPERFNPSIKGERVVQQYQLQGKTVIGFVGWFRKWHGVEMLLKVIHDLKDSMDNVRLLLVGTGPAHAELHEFAEKRGLLDRVFFTGPVQQDEVVQYIAAMDIAVQISATEYACPMKLIEYMGMAKCIVAPDQPNIREVLEDGVDAKLFKPHDHNGLKMALVDVIHDKEMRKVLGEKAHAKVCVQGYLWHRNAQRTLSFVFGKNASRRENNLEKTFSV
jgi:glycosyltransferase involved in cell wall biosynthesis